MTTPIKYRVKILTSIGWSYMAHKGRDRWALRTAKKHAKDIVQGKTGIKEWRSVIVVDEDGDVVAGI